ncbi:MAG TPA: putative toxin-antitoxin system toxin component, PIN family [Stellaceae bacterium]|jgi:putative PIN family toxin of toxin-antitoxin system|nr:putative toxin-antitoxin system toxin component, PIN family [Stellaceae bacterium]
MRIVLDTNVLVSAVLKSGTPPYDTVDWIDRHGWLLKSVETEREILEVLERPRLRSATIPLFVMGLRQMLACSEPVPITEHITACRDPKDDKFLELAINGHADVIVSGDADLLALHPFRGIPIETPAAFLRRVERA